MSRYLLEKARWLLFGRRGGIRAGSGGTRLFAGLAAYGIALWAFLLACSVALVWRTDWWSASIFCSAGLPCLPASSRCSMASHIVAATRRRGT